MLNLARNRTLTAILSIATIGATLSLGLAAARAGGNVTEDQIIRALTPPKKPLTRGLTIGPQTEPVTTAAEAKFVSSIRGRSTRSLSLGERDQIATIAQKKRKIDLEIDFDYDSAAINAKSRPSVEALGRALTTPDLKGSTFIVAGYTDAAGSDAYNQGLSERRADAIKRYLSENYGIPGDDLITVGYGKTRLKDPSHPLADVNRRVQVVNMEDKATASR
jgi:outer membrane protein OmpA-like peptidoglycan-associated protein